jgi:hypothetical protein
MPKPVDDLVETLLSNPDFYPDKSEKEQKAIAWKQYNKSNKKKTKKKSSNIINNIRIASNLVSYSYKLDDNGNFDIADELLKIAYSLIEK